MENELANPGIWGGWVVFFWLLLGVVAVGVIWWLLRRAKREQPQTTVKPSPVSGSAGFSSEARPAAGQAASPTSEPESKRPVASDYPSDADEPKAAPDPDRQPSTTPIAPPPKPRTASDYPPPAAGAPTDPADPGDPENPSESDKPRRPE